MSYCLKCGNDLPSDDVRCQKCGHLSYAASHQPHHQPSSPSPAPHYRPTTPAPGQADTNPLIYLGLLAVWLLLVLLLKPAHGMPPSVGRAITPCLPLYGAFLLYFWDSLAAMVGAALTLVIDDFIPWEYRTSRIDSDFFNYLKFLAAFILCLGFTELVYRFYFGHFFTLH